MEFPPIDIEHEQSLGTAKCLENREITLFDLASQLGWSEAEQLRLKEIYGKARHLENEAIHHED